MEEKECSSSEEEEDEELNGVLKISAIFSGDDVGKLDAFLPKNCIAETPPPSKSIAETPPPFKGIAETPPSSKAEREIKKIRKNLTTIESPSPSSNEPARLSNTSDPAIAEEEEDLITEEERKEESEKFEKPTAEEQSDDDDLEEILADEFL